MRHSTFRTKYFARSNCTVKQLNLNNFKSGYFSIINIKVAFRSLKECSVKKIAAAKKLCIYR